MKTLEFDVASSSQPVPRTVTLRYGEDEHGQFQRSWFCNCPGFRWRLTCRHLKEAQKLFLAGFNGDRKRLESGRYV